MSELMYANTSSVLFNLYILPITFISPGYSERFSDWHKTSLHSMQLLIKQQQQKDRTTEGRFQLVGGAPETYFGLKCRCHLFTWKKPPKI